jgi:hypothetical protein
MLSIFVLLDMPIIDTLFLLSYQEEKRKGPVTGTSKLGGFIEEGFLLHRV